MRKGNVKDDLNCAGIEIKKKTKKRIGNECRVIARRRKCLGAISVFVFIGALGDT